MPEAAHKLRIRLPDGAEFEAEGSAEFVERQRAEFVQARMRADGAATAPGRGAAGPGSGAQEGPRISWEAIAEASGQTIQLRSKLAGKNQEHDACLTLLACSEKLLRIHKPTAALLAKWLRASGYPITRVDRAIQNAVKQGEIMASGSRRARRYELTAPGRLKAFLLAEQLTRLISGPTAP